MNTVSDKIIQAHNAAMDQCEKQRQEHGVDVRSGRLYLQVKDRVTIFRRTYPHLALITDLIDNDNGRVVMTAKIYDGGVCLATGHAEEVRGQGPINKGSAIENCETSAIGRALANFGFHGGEYASANEIEGHERKVKANEENAPRPPAQRDTPAPPPPPPAPEPPRGDLPPELMTAKDLLNEFKVPGPRSVEMLRLVAAKCNSTRVEGEKEISIAKPPSKWTTREKTLVLEYLRGVYVTFKDGGVEMTPESLMADVVSEGGSEAA